MIKYCQGHTQEHVWTDVLQLLQILLTYFTSFVIPKSSQNHLQSKYLNVNSFQIYKSLF